MAPSRRRAHPAKLVVATLLLTASVVTGVAALVTATVPALGAATVFGVAAGVGAGALMFAEIVVMRRLWAHDRAQMADSYRNETLRRQQSHLGFVTDMTHRLAGQSRLVALRDTEVKQLQDAVLAAEIEMAVAKDRLVAEKLRVESLLKDAESSAAELAAARAEVRKAQDELAASEAASVAARAEILAWEETVAVAVAQRELDRRRLA